MWFFEKWFSRTKSPKETGNLLEEAATLLDSLKSKCGKEGVSKAIEDRLRDYRNTEDDLKLNQLPGLYLLFEQYLSQLNKLGSKSIMSFRKEIQQKYAGLVNLPDFKTIFVEKPAQEYLLCAFLLKEILKKAYDVMGAATDNQLEENMQSLDNSIQQVLTDEKTPIEDLRESSRLLSKKLFEKLSDRLGDRLIVNFYRSAYGTLSHNFRLLEAFPIILTLFPQKAMDDQQISLLNRDQMKTLLKEQVASLQSANNTLTSEIEERKLAQEELKRSEVKVTSLNEQLGKQLDKLEVANQELEAFSYTVAHDLRTPLRAIDGFSKILAEDYESTLDDEGKRLVNVVSGNVSKMSTLIDGLLTFSRLSRKSITKDQINTKRIVSETISELDIAKDQVVIGDLPLVQGERELIKDTFGYLLANAMKFSKNSTNRKIEVGCIEKGGFFEFYVKDNGVGFDMSYYDKLFGVFQTLHSDEELPGTGIGLSLAKKIIDKHDGNIWAKSEVNQGAEFYFTLPK